MKKSFKLINSSYSPENAQEVVSCLLNDKIRFLSVQQLRSIEFYGQKDEHFDQRIQELTADLDEIRSMLAQAAKDGYVVQLKSNVEVDLVPTQKTANTSLIDSNES